MRGLAERGIGQRVVLRSGGGLQGRLAAVAGVAVRPVGGSLLGALRATRGTGLVHAHEGRAVHAAYWRKLLSQVPYVITRRVNHAPKSGWLTRRAYRRADAIAALSQAVRRTLADYDRALDARVIPSAASRLRRDPERVRRLRERFAGRFVVGHIGALDQSTKGQLTLIRAARALGQVRPDILIVLVGEGRDEALLRREAEGLDNVEFAGFAADVGDWLAAFDLFAFPSLQEGLGSILLDALDFGLPIVASAVGGIPDIIVDGENGLLVPPADPEALKNAILALRSDSARRHALGRAARDDARRFSPERMVTAYLELYRSAAPGLLGPIRGSAR